jgi:hypothetical protein
MPVNVTMPVNVIDKIRKLSQARRKNVGARMFRPIFLGKISPGSRKLTF